MICPIVTSPIILQIPSTEATREDMPTGQDLKETLQAHAHECVGMAANMIGVRKRIIVVQDGDTPRLMFNPKILERAQEYQTEEGCLSLTGTRVATRFQRIKVCYLDSAFNAETAVFTGYTAQIIQHEIDHCDGIVI